MKKVIVLLSIITLVATGCSVKELSRDDFKENIDIVLAGKNNTYNVNFEGYKYYVPAGMSFQNKEEYNAILRDKNNNLYYLYIDVISYYHKTPIKYE